MPNVLLGQSSNGRSGRCSGIGVSVLFAVADPKSCTRYSLETLPRFAFTTYKIEMMKMKKKMLSKDL